MESTNNHEANHNCGYGPINLKAFNMNTAMVKTWPQATNNIGKVFHLVLDLAARPLFSQTDMVLFDISRFC